MKGGISCSLGCGGMEGVCVAYRTVDAKYLMCCAVLCCAAASVLSQIFGFTRDFGMWDLCR